MCWNVMHITHSIGIAIYYKHLWSLLLILKPSLFLSPLIPPWLPSSNLPMLTHLSLYLPWLPLSPLTLSLRIRVRLQHPPELRRRKKELCERYIIHRRLDYLCISIGIHFLPILGMILSDMYFSCKGKKHDEMPSLFLKGSVYAASLCKAYQSSHVCMSVHLVSLIVNTLSCKYRIAANFRGY